MHFSKIALAVLPAFALAAPSIKRQGAPGDPGFYNTVAEIYSGQGCTADTFVWGDPIFGLGGQCQLLDRNDNTPDIYSYKVVQQYPDCVATLYTDTGCQSVGVVAPLNECISSAEPFVMAFVQCPFS
ncbi:hypothetical protein P154DRAFT_576577 [Amniculicola lignicola CBS 123094]|uniref:Uncharacterized protein n=1 Tax=Amniculicola lignicola CBS 123094 TaxID=1392246 RepID=A0A6A5WE92_9PLEO|nr:hypothetical protein P154DRAFT_576577 [Amniculicola lignicola CBS 123094]